MAVAPQPPMTTMTVAPQSPKTTMTVAPQSPKTTMTVVPQSPKTTMAVVPQPPKTTMTVAPQPPRTTMKTVAPQPPRTTMTVAPQPPTRPMITAPQQPPTRPMITAPRQAPRTTMITAPRQAPRTTMTVAPQPPSNQGNPQQKAPLIKGAPQGKTVQMPSAEENDAIVAKFQTNIYAAKKLLENQMIPFTDQRLDDLISDMIPPENFVKTQNELIYNELMKELKLGINRDEAKTDPDFFATHELFNDTIIDGVTKEFKIPNGNNNDDVFLATNTNMKELKDYIQNLGENNQIDEVNKPKIAKLLETKSILASYVTALGPRTNELEMYLKWVFIGKMVSIDSFLRKFMKVDINPLIINTDRIIIFGNINNLLVRMLLDLIILYEDFLESPHDQKLDSLYQRGIVQTIAILNSVGQHNDDVMKELQPKLEKYSKLLLAKAETTAKDYTDNDARFNGPTAPNPLSTNARAWREYDAVKIRKEQNK
jgi:hypothetical protein